MFVKFNSPIAGHRFSYKPGDLVEIDDDSGIRLCSRGITDEITRTQAILEAEARAEPIRKHKAPTEESPAVTPKKSGVISTVGELLKSATTRFTPALVKDD